MQTLTMNEQEMVAGGESWAYEISMIPTTSMILGAVAMRAARSAPAAAPAGVPAGVPAGAIGLTIRGPGTVNFNIGISLPSLAINTLPSGYGPGIVWAEEC
jgi:hypothetical protein